MHHVTQKFVIYYNTNQQFSKSNKHHIYNQFIQHEKGGQQRIQQERESRTYPGNKGESAQEVIAGTQEEGISEEQEEEPVKHQLNTSINYKNGDTVTYKGKQYEINGIGKDEAGSPLFVIWN